MSGAPNSAAGGGTPAWSAADLAGDPHARSDKPARVRSMFSAIAGSYDLNNRLHSFWQDQRWRRFAVREAGVTAETDALDVACGTGDLTRLLAGAGARRVVGLDFTRAMLDVAETKRTRPSDARIEYVEGDATRLPFEPASFDVLTIAFGIRNVGDPRAALREFRRVLRPGGRLVVLEFDRPRLRVVGAVSEFYTNRVMPWTATLISGDRSGAYRYLPKSVRSFMNTAEMGEAIGEAGFGEWRATGLSLGVCVCHRAVAR
ncbi:MAG: bifunctional demethylmenaquinone methyltransferase/2-methoxy-6-polyprenyl-1,4-benzoquinol methylase UbiE [Phycisphaerae bacterium]|nr:bifunctional demethylmenaquinone methyltransferase/2-methoxy-6-polyprenyl-1,4-benzoquinol methylase UbiE [Phycisphaerae bacterium]